ncbi:RusA family crossover junction endodeoxyribonuclease [Muricoccus vinaceus]|uniref:RusA family crossover junction endodeoxyribonuclease n=1 Tax=Muricoccus vinaceus TaxID=424704 RepID=A0ABV6INL2_9PROT
MEGSADITLLLPEPPSTNRMWRNVVIGGAPRTLKAKPYREWLDAAARVVAEQSHADRIEGGYRIRITAPKQRRDLGNNEKPINDLLQAAGVVRDDKACEVITIRRDLARELGHLLVELWAV